MNVITPELYEAVASNASNAGFLVLVAAGLSGFAAFISGGLEIRSLPKIFAIGAVIMGVLGAAILAVGTFAPLLVSP
jgi:hypothetical protein